jgi:hypothetical protein
MRGRSCDEGLTRGGARKVFQDFAMFYDVDLSKARPAPSDDTVARHCEKVLTETKREGREHRPYVVITMATSDAVLTAAAGRPEGAAPAAYVRARPGRLSALSVP